MLDSCSIQHIYTTPYKVSSKGLCERSNRTIVELLRNLSASPSNWDELLPTAVITYNNTLHSELGMTPAQYLINRQHNVQSNPPLPSAVTQHWKEENPAFAPFRRGQKVLRKVVFQGRQNVDKLANRFQRPFAVIKVNPNKVTYIIKDEETGETSRAHHVQL